MATHDFTEQPCSVHGCPEPTMEGAPPLVMDAPDGNLVEVIEAGDQWPAVCRDHKGGAFLALNVWRRRGSPQIEREKEQA